LCSKRSVDITDEVKAGQFFLRRSRITAKCIGCQTSDTNSYFIVEESSHVISSITFHGTYSNATLWSSGSIEPGIGIFKMIPGHRTSAMPNGFCQLVRIRGLERVVVDLTKYHWQD
jgi:hypothetical protein